MGEPGGLLSIVLYKVSHNWSDLAAAAAYNTHYIKIKFWDSGHVLQGKSKYWKFDLKRKVAPFYTTELKRTNTNLEEAGRLHQGRKKLET